MDGFRDVHAAAQQRFLHGAERRKRDGQRRLGDGDRGALPNRRWVFERRSHLNRVARIRQVRRDRRVAVRIEVYRIELRCLHIPLRRHHAPVDRPCEERRVHAHRDVHAYSQHRLLHGSGCAHGDRWSRRRRRRRHVRRRSVLRHPQRYPGDAVRVRVAANPVRVVRRVVLDHPLRWGRVVPLQHLHKRLRVIQERRVVVVRRDEHRRTQVVRVRPLNFLVDKTLVRLLPLKEIAWRRVNRQSPA